MTENNDTRRFYLPADRDKLSALDNITSRLDRIAAALDRLTGVSETPTAWTVTDASGRTICAGTDSNAADLVQKALEGYAPGEYTLHCPGDGEAVSF